MNVPSRKKIIRKVREVFDVVKPTVFYQPSNLLDFLEHLLQFLLASHEKP
jgi:hypothetical protein